jgi:hypothetical protein
MDHPGDIDGFLESLPPMSDAEGAETVLRYLHAQFHAMSTETLRTYRAHCVRMQSGERDQTVVVQVIDELLALRETGHG